VREKNNDFLIYEDRQSREEGSKPVDKRNSALVNLFRADYKVLSGWRIMKEARNFERRLKIKAARTKKLWGKREGPRHLSM